MAYTISTSRNPITRGKAVNRFLDSVSRIYHHAIPLNDIFRNLRANGFEPVQEDGTAWDGFLVGRTGRAIIALHEASTGKPVRFGLSLSWYKMDSGRYEVTAYVA